MKLILVAAICLVSSIAMALDSKGRVVVLCGGMSNASQECEGWRKLSTTGYRILNGALAGRDYAEIITHSQDYWDRLDYVLANNGLAREDVDIFLNHNTLSNLSTNRNGFGKPEIGEWNNLMPVVPVNPDTGLPIADHPITYIEFFYLAVPWFQDHITAMFPNLQGAYQATRETARLDPATQDWCTKAPIELAVHSFPANQAALGGPWKTGPDYSSIAWVREDFISDGCHPSETGKAKIAELLNGFFNGAPPPPPPPPVECPVL